MREGGFHNERAENVLPRTISRALVIPGMRNEIFFPLKNEGGYIKYEFPG